MRSHRITPAAMAARVESNATDTMDDVAVRWLLVVRQLRSRPEAAADLALLIGPDAVADSEMPATLDRVVSTWSLDL